MPVDRNLWKGSFSEGSFPAWPCPRCNGVGTLSIVKGTLHWSETAQSIQCGFHPDWHPEETEGRFACLSSCSRCREVIAICGDTELRYEADWDGKDYVQDHVPYHHPTSVSPSPSMFPISKHCPECIREEIKGAFKLYWSDPGSSMNRLRAGVELLLNEMRIVRSVKTKKGKRRRLTLHERIVNKLQPVRPHFAEALLAVKWLGNAGSHPGQVSQDDVLDGMELMEHILHERYEPRQKAVSRLSKEINRRRGPRLGGRPRGSLF
jgi:hypothetical protein